MGRQVFRPRDGVTGVTTIRGPTIRGLTIRGLTIRGLTIRGPTINACVGRR